MGVNITSSKQVHAHSAGCARPRVMFERRPVWREVALMDAEAQQSRAYVRMMMGAA